MKLEDQKLTKDFIDKLRSYAECANASYALLHYVFENDECGFADEILGIKRWKSADKIQSDYQYDGKATAYAKAIEVCFNEDKVIGETCDVSIRTGNRYCSPKTLNNNILNLPETISLEEISQRTKDFVSRFEIGLL